MTFNFNFSIFKVHTCKVKRGAKDQILREAILASERLKMKLEEEFKENQKITANLVSSESKIHGLRDKLIKINPMDNKSIKLLYEEAVNLKKSLTPELNSVSFNNEDHHTVVAQTCFIYRLELRNWNSQLEIQL